MVFGPTRPKQFSLSQARRAITNGASQTAPPSFASGGSTSFGTDAKSISANIKARGDKNVRQSEMKSLVDSNYHGFTQEKWQDIFWSKGYKIEGIQQPQTFGQAIKEDFNETVDQQKTINKATQGGDQTRGEHILQSAGNVAGLASDVVGEGLMRGVKSFVQATNADDLGASIAKGIQRGMVKTGINDKAYDMKVKILESDTVKNGLNSLATSVEDYNNRAKANPVEARNLGASFNMMDMAANLVGLGAGAKATKTASKKVIDKGLDVVGKGLDIVGSKTKPIKESIQKTKNSVAEGFMASNLKNPAMREKYISRVGQTPEKTLLDDGITGPLWSQTKQVLEKASSSMKKARSEAKKITETVSSAEGAWISDKIVEGVDMTIPGMEERLAPILSMSKRFKDGTATAEDLITAKTYLSRYESIYDDFGRIKKSGDVFEKESLSKMYTTMKESLEGLGKRAGVDFEIINKNTMKYQGLRDIMTRAVSRESGRDMLSLSDYVMGGVGITVDPFITLTTLASKKVLQNPNISSKLAKFLYKKSDDVLPSNVRSPSVGALPNEVTGQTVKKSKK